MKSTRFARRPTRSATIALGASLASVAILLALAPAPAHARSAKPNRYWWIFEAVQLKSAAPETLIAPLQESLSRQIAEEPRVVSEVPGAPDPETDPKKLERYLKRHKIRAHKVYIEVTEYRYDIEELPAPRRGKRLTVSLSLRLFGDTFPRPMMAFGGDGSATVKVDVGRRVRTRDSEYAQEQVINVAIAKAFAEALARLDLPPAKPIAEKKKHRKRRKNRKRR